MLIFQKSRSSFFPNMLLFLGILLPVVVNCQTLSMMIPLLFGGCRRISLFLNSLSGSTISYLPRTSSHFHSLLWYSLLPFFGLCVHELEHHFSTSLLSPGVFYIPIPFLSFLLHILIGNLYSDGCLKGGSKTGTLILVRGGTIFWIFWLFQTAYSGVNFLTNWPNLILWGVLHSCIIWLSKCASSGWP